MPKAPPSRAQAIESIPPKVRLHLDGAHTRIHAELCIQCPHNPAGCCAAPPAVAWTDIGRIASLAGIDFLLTELEHGRLKPSPLGLSIQRQPASSLMDRAMPARCIYLGPAGCTLGEHQRSATCNYYICEEALAEGGPVKTMKQAKRAHESLSAFYAQCDLELGQLVHSRHPDGPPWDRAFLVGLKEGFEQILRRIHPQLRDLFPPHT